jgi:hypothetical protein
MNEQLSCLAIGSKKKILKGEVFLREMEAIVPWEWLCTLIEPHYTKRQVGLEPFTLPLLMRIYCLQQCFGLNEPSVEEFIYDRASFQRFLGLDIANDDVPDQATILNFRRLMEEQQLPVSVFAKIKEHLEQKGFSLQSGTIMDEPEIAAPSSTKNFNDRRESEISARGKDDQSHVVTQANVGVDAHSETVQTVATTAQGARQKITPKVDAPTTTTFFGISFKNPEFTTKLDIIFFVAILMVAYCAFNVILGVANHIKAESSKEEMPRIAYGTAQR